jgi:hypothetical protein
LALDSPFDLIRFNNFSAGSSVGVCGDEVVAEGASKEGGGQPVHLCVCLRQPRLGLGGQRKQPFHPAHDFRLSG